MNKENEKKLQQKEEDSEDNEEEEEEEDDEEDKELELKNKNNNENINKDINKEESNKIKDIISEANNIKEQQMKNEEVINSNKDVNESINKEYKEEIKTENLQDDKESKKSDETDDKSIPKKANNNKYIYTTYKDNVFYVDETDDSYQDNYKLSAVNKSDINNNIKNKFNKKSFYKRSISFSENEQIDIESSSESYSESYEEVSEDKDENDENTSINNINTEKDSFLLELNDNGLPNLSNEEILSCNINSLINISINNGIPISKDIFMITNAENEFPSPCFLNSLINEVKLKNEKSPDDNYASNLSLKHQKYLNNLNEDNNVFKHIKKYQIFPNRINTKIYFKINCRVSGNITFIFLYKSSDNKSIKFTKPFHILVNPLININNKLMEINQIQMQSIIPKNIGNLEKDFEKYYEEVSLLGYNFIHFNSFQKLSKEGNIFVIEDQNDLNDDFFINDSNDNIKNLEPKQKYQLLLNSIKNLKNKYNIGSISDIILSQTSTESKWIYENKDCTYNLKNTPWLNAAFELDKILMNYSKLFKEKKVSCKSAPYIYNINDIEEIITEIQGYIDKGQLENYFLISEEKYINEFKDFYDKLKDEEFKKNFMNKKEVLLNEIVKDCENKQEKITEIFTNINYIYKLLQHCCINYGYEKFGVKICIEFMSIIILQCYKEVNNTNKLPLESVFLNDVKSFINMINKKWTKQIKELLKISLLNIKEYLKYKYLQLNNKKKIDQLIDSYFVIKNEKDPSEIFLCNGWLMDTDKSNSLYVDTIHYGSWYYLKRKIIVSKNTIKINYGENIENTSLFLINHMTEYISNLAFIFDGLFIDSIRYIPLSILKYFVYIARKVNPNLILLANISSSSNNISFLLQKKYTEEIGINLFVNELIWNNSINEVINSIIKNGCNTNNNIYTEIMTHFNSYLYSSSFVGENKILLGKYKCLKPKKPINIIYDVFNNKTYYEKFRKLSLNISISSLISLLDTSIGSTFGFDQLFPLLPKLENENRKYELNQDIKDLITKIDEIKTKGEEDLEIFFEYHPNENQPFNDINSINSVHIALNYFDYNPNIELTKITNNLYMTKISIPPGKYFYQYLINNEIWTYDNTQPMVEDQKGIIYNTIDLRNQNKIILPDLRIFRREINNMRKFFQDKQSEIYVQKNQDMCGIIRIITDNNVLINNNIETNKIEEFKNILSEDSINEEEKDVNLKDNELNKKSIISNPKDTTNKLKLSKNELLSKSFEYLNNIDSNIILNENKAFVNSIEIKNQNDVSKTKILNSTNDKTSLNSTNVDLNISNSSNISGLHDGYAIISFPYFENDKNKKGKGIITIPGKISLVCGCYLNDKNIINDISNILLDKKIKGGKNEVIFTKDMNYLKSIAKIKYKNNETIIEFFNAPQNISFIFKFKNDFNYICNDLNKNLEILLNNGNDLINYLDETDINKLLYGNENGSYEMKINLFKIINESSKLTNTKLKYKFMTSGINQIIELIKIIKKTENQEMFFNNKSTEISDQFENEYDFINSPNDRKIIVQSFYKDVYNSDNLINYLIDKLKESKSFNLIYKFVKEIIYPKYKLLPNFIKTYYFEKIITSIYQIIFKISLGTVPRYLLNFGELAIGLSLTRYQFIKKNQNSNSAFDDKLLQQYTPDKNPTIYQKLLGLTIINGLPIKNKNFKISLKVLLLSFNSLFLIPKSYYEAKIILKLIGSTMKNGLFPDYLENNSSNYKYNSLDISWLYIKAIREYIEQSQDYNFLKENIYLLNAPENINYSYFRIKDKNKKNELSVENIIQFIFQYYAQGIIFNIINKNIENVTKEKKNEKTKKIKIKNKSKNIDINIPDIILDIQTGFIFKKNVNVFDKNIKIRTNLKYTADIEIISLLFDCINFVIKINNNNYYPYSEVILSDNNRISFYQWSLLIKKSFEKEFIVDDKSIKTNFIIKQFENNVETNNESILKNKTESVINKKKEIESKVNPNILLAIYYSPDLFPKEVIIQSIEYIEKYFLREENEFNSEPSFQILKGVRIYDKSNNYQEYSYLYGIYLMIKMNYFYNINNIYENSNEIIRYISKKLYPYIQNIKESHYMGIPEIIDEDGNISEDGYKSDLKSFAIFYELLEKISHFYFKANKLQENEQNILSKN